MKSVLIYPFGKEVEPIVSHFKQLKSIYPVCIVGLNGWNDGKQSYNIEDEEIPLTYEFRQGYKQYNPDIVWFVDSRAELEFERDYLPFIEMAAVDGKEIIASNKLRKMIGKYFVDNIIKYYDETTTYENEQEIGEFLKQINTPIIYICGLYEGVGKFELQLMILKELRERNISTVQIGTREEFAAFGIHTMPIYMTDETVVDKKKILMLNNYLKELEKTEKPELIVLGVPGELYFPSFNYVAGCGLLALDCFYATEPDVLVVALPYEEYTKNNLMQIAENIESKFGIKVDAFVRTNKRFLYEETEIAQKCTYLTISEKDMNHSEQCNDYIFELKQSHIKVMVDDILSKLRKYGKIESI